MASQACSSVALGVSIHAKLVRIELACSALSRMDSNMTSREISYGNLILLHYRDGVVLSTRS